MFHFQDFLASVEGFKQEELKHVEDVKEVHDPIVTAEEPEPERERTSSSSSSDSSASDKKAETGSNSNGSGKGGSSKGGRQLVNEDACPDGKPLLFLLTTVDPTALDLPENSKITWHNPVANLHKSNLELTDFAWNHTTLWAMKADPAWTYLQDTFDPENYVEHLRLRKAKYGDDVIDHVEFTGAGGEPYPAGLTIVRYRSDEQLQEMIDYGESIGILQYSPHTTVLDEPNTRWEYKHLLEAKKLWDPHNLLNPGHLLNVFDSD